MGYEKFREKVLTQIKEIVKERLPLAKIYLYGSRAKVIASSESDRDLIILLNKDKISLEDEQEITYPLYDLEFDIGEVKNPVYGKNPTGKSIKKNTNEACL